MFRDRDGWRVSWRSAGKRHSKMFPSKAQANLFESQLKAGVLTNPQVSADSFETFATRWLEDYCRVEKSPGQYVNDESAIRNHLLPTFGATRLASITKAQVAEFRIALRRRCKRVKTANLILALFKQILATAVEWDVIPKSPAASLKGFPLDEQVADYWTSEERDRFWRFARHVEPEFTRAVLIACHTGLRRGEIAALERHQLDFDNRLILVNATWCYRTKQRLKRVKNRRIGWVPMNDAVYAELLEFKNAPSLTRIVEDPGTLLHAARDLRALAKRFGLRGIRFHDLRHTFASGMALAGVNQTLRQRLMRHQDARMTDRYTHLVPGYLAEGVAALARSPTRENPEIDVKASND